MKTYCYACSSPVPYSFVFILFAVLTLWITCFPTYLPYTAFKNIHNAQIVPGHTRTRNETLFFLQNLCSPTTTMRHDEAGRPLEYYFFFLCFILPFTHSQAIVAIQNAFIVTSRTLSLSVFSLSYIAEQILGQLKC